MADVDNYYSDYENEVEGSDFESDGDVFDEENVAPPKKGSKPASKSDKGILSSNDNSKNLPVSKKEGGKKTIEEMYQKKSQLEHILIRPDTYIGSVERTEATMFVLDGTKKRMVSRNITYTPGLYKIFDEILVNAADNKQRDEDMNKLDITIDAEKPQISVKNNGRGIPVAKHEEEKCYVPSMIFGELLTGSNFDDNEKKTTGGRNGYGAKLANIFSTEFIVECMDSTRGLKFTQVFRNNMGVKEEPTIKEATAAEKKKGDYTKITFSPDLARFKMTEMDDDTVALLSKRAYDIAGSMANRPGKKLAVTLNGEKLPIKSFADYINLFDGINPPSAYEKIGDRWEVGISSTEGIPAQISFVNAICTSKGGNHVNAISDQVAKYLEEKIQKKNKGGKKMGWQSIRNYLCVFVNCLVDNPTFDSQTKENLTTQRKKFGSDCKLTPKFLKQVEKSDVVDTILSFAEFKAKKELKNKGGTKKKKLTGIPKLEDANHAGGAKSKDCTLIITEGDSAKSLAVSGLSVVGRDLYGVFPLRGKPLNVRDATTPQVSKNAEIKNIIEILGLKFGVEYDETNIKTLRYGHLMIMADQDHDGSHIKGLVINMIHNFWPSLLDVPGFLQQFITPIVKATKKGQETQTFFSQQQYNEWYESTGDAVKSWDIKYYKGLGTSTSKEAKEYFSNLGLHEVTFMKLSDDVVARPSGDSDDSMDHEAFPDINVSSSGSDLIDMAFRKKRVDDRKTWLNNMEKEAFIDYYQEEGIKYSDFINKELVQFSKADNARSIPHVMDGFKPSQRKVLFAAIKKSLKKEMKVAQFAGYVGEHSAYHHGEASLHGTIVGMAQDYCGSNNLNLLTPAGQFGTRRMGGKDAASPRYIFTALEKIARAIYHPDDDDLLTYLNEEGLSIEPEHYMPVIPMVLVNGCDGIGTGWATKIPNYNPKDIIANLRRMIRGEELEQMLPWYHGFSGEIVQESPGKFQFKGKIERTDDTTLFISELQVGKWTQDYKVFLEGMMTCETKGENPDIIDFQENHTDTTISFTLTCDKNKIDTWEAQEKGGLLGKFKLSTSQSANMNLFDTKDRIVKYTAPEDIMKEFFNLRTEFYEKRKKSLVDKLQYDQGMLSNKARFVEEVCEGKLVVSNRKKKDLLSDLKERGYKLFDKTTKHGPAGDDEDADGDDDAETEDSSLVRLSKGYEYLLGMKIWSLTYEKAVALRKQLDEKTSELEELQKTSPSQIWLNDLDVIDELLDEREVKMREAENDVKKAQKTSSQKRAASKKKPAPKKKAAKKKKKKDEWDSEMEESDGEQNAFGDDESVEEVATKKATASRRKPAAKPAAKPTAKQAAKTAAKPSRTTKSKPVVAAPAAEGSKEKDDDDDMNLSLMERMMKKKLVTESSGTESMEIDATLSKEPSFSDDDETNSRGRKRPSPRANDDDEEEDVFEFEETAKAPAKKIRAKPAKRARATKKPAAKKGGKKKAVAKDESDDEFGSDTESKVEEKTSVKNVGQRARSSRAAQKKATYVYDDDSDEVDGSDEDAYGSDGGDSGSESDF